MVWAKERIGICSDSELFELRSIVWNALFRATKAWVNAFAAISTNKTQSARTFIAPHLHRVPIQTVYVDYSLYMPSIIISGK